MKKILVVDDDDSIREIAAAFLRNEGYDVFEASCVSAANETLSNTATDLILTDYHMPDETGGDLLKKVRQNYPRVKVVLMTAAGCLVSRQEKSGFDGVISKPFRKEEFLRIIRSVVG